MGSHESGDSQPPGRLEADPAGALEEQPDAQQAMVDDATVPQLAVDDAGEPDRDTPIFQEPGGPPTTSASPA